MIVSYYVILNIIQFILNFLKSNKVNNNEANSYQRIGHAYALIDIIDNGNKSYIKMRNCQTNLKIKKENNQ